MVHTCFHHSVPTVGKFTDSSNATFLEAISKSITSDSNLDAHFVLPPFLSRRCSLTAQRHLSSAVRAFHHSNHTRGPALCTWLLAPEASYDNVLEGYGRCGDWKLFFSLYQIFERILIHIFMTGNIIKIVHALGQQTQILTPGLPPTSVITWGTITCSIWFATIPSAEWGKMLIRTLISLPRLGWGRNKMSIVNMLFINIRLSLGLRQNRALPFKVKRNGLFSFLTFMVILFYSYGIHVKNSPLLWLS